MALHQRRSLAAVSSAPGADLNSSSSRLVITSLDDSKRVPLQRIYRVLETGGRQIPPKRHIRLGRCALSWFARGWCWAACVVFHNHTKMENSSSLLEVPIVLEPAQTGQI